MDTFQGFENDSITLHKYLYSNIDPVNNVDPSGNFALLRQVGSFLRVANVFARNTVRSVARRHIISGFSRAERSVIKEARVILKSKNLDKIRAAHKAGKGVTVKVKGRLIQYEPGLPSSGMTMFGENGFERKRVTKKKGQRKRVKRKRVRSCL